MSSLVRGRYCQMIQQYRKDSHLFTEPESYEDFEVRLIRALGATVGGKALTQALGYPSQEAFRKARKRGRLPVLTFEMAGRRGRFASVTDIAAWLWHQRHPSAPIDQDVDR